jgi:hypothetical protein
LDKAFGLGDNGFGAADPPPRTPSFQFPTPASGDVSGQTALRPAKADRLFLEAPWCHCCVKIVEGGADVGIPEKMI